MCAALITALAGGPWLALQTVAWVRMIIVYSKQDGLLQGVAKTFDGQHPCSLCASIAQARTEEGSEESGKKAPPQNESLWQAVLSCPLSCIPFDSSSFLPAAADPAREGLLRSPLTPPPRA